MSSLGSTASRLLCKQLPLLRRVVLVVGCRSRRQWNLGGKRPLRALSSSSTTIDDESNNPSGSYQQDEGVLRLLSNEQLALLQEQRELTRRATQVAEDLQLPSSLSSSSVVHQLESSMFSIVVAGEFNGGKSTFLNALLGKPLLEMGPLPTTDSITIVTGAGIGSRNSSSSTTTKEVDQHSGIVIHRVGNTTDVNFLSDDLILVDTPGSNSLSDGHEFRTKRWLPHADLILFVISADRPMSESERSFLKSMERYRKQIILVINKIDLLESLGDNYGQDAKQHVIDYVTENASTLLGRRPLVFPISARNALECKVSSSFIWRKNPSARRTSAIYSESPTWKRSGLETLQKFLIEELTNEAKVKTKLCNPIRVAESIARDALETLNSRQKALDSDNATLLLLEEQMKAWEVLMVRDMKNGWDGVNQLLLKDSNKLHDSLLNKRIRFINQLMLYVSRKRFHRHCEDLFTNKIDLMSQIDAIVKESSDSFATKVKSQSQATLEYLGNRPMSCSNKMVGTMSKYTPTHDQIQKSLYEKISRTITQEIDKYEPEQDVAQLFQSLQRITIATCAVEFSAAIAFFDSISALLSSSSVHILSTLVTDSLTMGIMASTTFLTMIVGIIAYPRKINKTVVDYRQATAERFEEAISSKLLDISKGELIKLNQKIAEGILPYKIFCMAESDRIQRLQTESEEILAIGHNLRRRIEKKH